MNLSLGGMAPKLELILVLMAAAAALTVTLVSSAPAGAESGGTSTTSGGSGDGGKYQHMWRRASRHSRRWARRTAECESGKNPDAIGGGGKDPGAVPVPRATRPNAPQTPGGDPNPHG